MFMCDFQVPHLLFYAYLLTLFLSVVFGFLILFSDRKSQVNRNLFVFIALFSFWILDDLMAWLIHVQRINVLIDRLAIIETFSVLFFLYFIFAFLEKNISTGKKLILAIPYLPMILFMFTNYNIYVVDEAGCQNQIGLLYGYVFLVVFVYMTTSVMEIIKGYKKAVDEKKKKQIRIIGWSITFFVSWFLILVATRYFLVFNNVAWGDNVFLFVPLGMVIFIGMLSSAIVRYKLFNIKLIAAQALTYSIWLLIGSQFFFVENRVNIVLIAITLLFSVVFGVVLIRSVRAEIQRKEELQIMADRLAVANDELRKLDNAKTEFISIASHQLRTPLTAIKGFVSLLLEGAYGEVNPEAREAINKIHLSGERLIRLVEDLLNVSRIEAGRMIFEKKPGQFEDVVKEICEGLEMLAREKNLYLDWKLPKEKLPSFDFDASKMKEVVSNLVENAIKYSDKGGVTVRVERTQQTTNDKSQDGGTQEIIRFTVSDTGIGIPADEIPNLFKKFSRGKNTKRLNATGTGLGLFVVKNIVENHGGKIWIESKGEGMGTKFVVELPIESL